MTSQPTQGSHHDCDHVVRQPTPWAGGVSEVGVKIPPNQDALVMAATADPNPRSAVIAVSDGVSSSLNAHIAAQIAAEVAVDHMIAALQTQPGPDVEELTLAMVDAFAHANQEILTRTGGLPRTSACTLVLAVLHQNRILVANLGDSRAYWFGDDGTHELLSVDDSMAQLSMALGASRAEAEQSVRAHAITKWLGPDSPSIQPRIVLHDGGRPGWLLVCSDGLWNQASEPDALAGVLGEVLAAADGQPSRAAAKLANWALDRGSRDNITVALVRVDSPASEARPSERRAEQNQTSESIHPDLSGVNSALGERRALEQPALPFDG